MLSADAGNLPQIVIGDVRELRQVPQEANLERPVSMYWN